MDMFLVFGNTDCHLVDGLENPRISHGFETLGDALRYANEKKISVTIPQTKYHPKFAHEKT